MPWIKGTIWKDNLTDAWKASTVIGICPPNAILSHIGREGGAENILALIHKKPETIKT